MKENIFIDDVKVCMVDEQPIVAFKYRDGESVKWFTIDASSGYLYYYVSDEKIIEHLVTGNDGLDDEIKKYIENSSIDEFYGFYVCSGYNMVFMEEYLSFNEDEVDPIFHFIKEVLYSLEYCTNDDDKNYVSIFKGRYLKEGSVGWHR